MEISEIRQAVDSIITEDGESKLSQRLGDIWHEDSEWLIRCIGNRKNVILNGADIVIDRTFTAGETEACNFDNKILINCRFSNILIKNCRFRGAVLMFCDFRYSTVSGGTFEGATFLLCDFYRTFFCELIRFAGAIFRDCSLNNTFFSGGAMIGTDNFYDSRLVQDYADRYEMFLRVWNIHRPQSDKIDKTDSITTKVRLRHEELVLIYKSLYAGFVSNGFSNDANWAYAEACRNERKVETRLTFATPGISLSKRMRHFGSATLNFCLDLFFGYGNSLFKILMTYITIIVIFTIIYYYRGDVGSFMRALIISIKNMAGISSTELSSQDNVFLDFLNLIQTTVGILMTGVFGFILGVKMRRQ